MRRPLVVLALAGLLATITAPALAVTPGEPGRIAYVRYQDEDPRQLVTVDQDATDFTPIVVDDEPVSGPAGAAYSPDGRWLAYLHNWGGSLAPRYEMRVVRADGTGDRPIFRAGEITPPTWSPDGRQVAAYSNGNDNIAISDQTGARLYSVQIEGQVCNAGAIRWSPDGQRFALSRWCRSSGGAVSQVWTVDVDGTNPQRLTNLQDTFGAQLQDWSPDSRQLLYSTAEGLWLMGADGTSQRRIPNTGARDGAARFSGDGRQIVFTRWRDGHEHFQTAELFRIGVDGTGLTQLTSVPDGVSHVAASWQSLPAYTAAACPEGDVPSAGFDDASGTHAASVDCAVWHSLASGRDADTYAPTMPVRRDQIATFLARLLERSGVELPTPSPQGFDDIDGNTHADAINQLAELSIIAGIDADTYGPARPMTRAQMASLLVRTYEHVTGDDLDRFPDQFSDDDGSSHELAIDRATFAGFTSGVTVSTYAPGASVRRDQMATFLVRVVDRLVQEGHVELPQ